MKADIIFVNKDEAGIENAKNLGLPEPDPIESKGVIYFDKEFIHLAYLNGNNEIIIYLPSGYWVIEYNEEIWYEIKRYLEKK